MNFLKGKKPGTEVAQIPQAAQQIAAQDTTGLVHIFHQLAMNPEMPVEKMEQVVALYERVKAEQARVAFYEAMNRVQKLTPPIYKDAWNDHTKSWYAKIESVARALKPIYTGEGFTLSASEIESPHKDHVRVKMIVRHIAGHNEEHFRDMAVDITGPKGERNKTLTHGEASAFTYGARYLTCWVFNVVPEGHDDDGNAAAGKTKRTPKGGTVRDEHAETLRKLIEETGTNLDSFLGYWKAESLETFPAKDFNAAMDLLNQRKRGLERKAAQQ